MTREEILSTPKDAGEQLKEIESLKAEIESLKSKLKEVQENEIPKFPHFGNTETYWSTDGELEVYWGKTVLSCEKDDYNYFHTKEYATIFATKCREIARLLHCKWYVNRYYTPNFNDSNQMKWTVYYNYMDKCYKTDFRFSDYQPTVYFENKEVAQKAADWMNKYFKFN